MNSGDDEVRQAMEEDEEFASSDSFKVQPGGDKEEEASAKKDHAAQVSVVKHEKYGDEETAMTDECITSSAQTQKHSNHSPRNSSLQLRKLPVSDLLMPETEQRQREKSFLLKQEEETERRGLLRRTCLNPKFTLRTQLILSFDNVNLICIAVVVIICVAVAHNTGENIKSINSSTFSGLAEQIQGRTARYLAESLQHRIIPQDEVNIMYEVTRDRFQGFPTNVQVPFINMDTNTSQYPIAGAPLLLDWQLENITTPETDAEDVQGRLKWYAGNPMSTASGAFIMQGACDPAETDSSSRTYWPNCIAANNDVATGGIVRPSNSTETIYAMASDLVPTMKALYEYNQDILDIGVYFKNEGVGAGVNFPHYAVDANSSYSSVGCEWMKESNPYNKTKPIASQEEIDRCYAEGAVLSSRQYNPLVRGWCRDQALHPEKIMVEGPYINAWDENSLLLSSGRAIYDRATNEFLACIYVGMSTLFVEEIMRESRVTPNSEVSIVRWDPNGSVVASSAQSMSDSAQLITAVELGLGMTKETYNALYDLVDYEGKWDPVQVQKAYESFTSRAEGFIVAAYPIPPVPDKYDPDYRPVFLAMTSAAEADVFGEVQEVNEDVDERVNQATWFSVIVGAAGFVLATVVILITSTAITKPLHLMNKDAEQIVGSFGDEGANAQQIQPIYMSYSRCVPTTEITDVVREYNRMISSFSGSLMARTEGGKYVEVKNAFDVYDDFMGLYKSRKSSELPYGGILPKEGPVTTGDRVMSKGAPSIAATDGDTLLINDNAPLQYQFVHTGSNLKIGRPLSRQILSSRDLQKSRKRTTSPLFVWIVILIVTPLLLTTITISAVVISSMSREFDESVKDAEAQFLNVAVQALSLYAGLRADFVSTLTSRSVRDLYLMTRLSDWIMFDGLERADSYSEVVTAVNECLEAESSSTCPWTIENRVCDCGWNYADTECVNYPEITARRLQVPYFFVSSDSALPNGTRLSTDFPLNSVSPDTTLWWDGPYDLPGANMTESAAGYSTTYDRMRVISAFPLFSALVNYEAEREKSNGYFFAFEEDGLFFANEGCSNSRHSYAAFWKSTIENGAERLRPELCPLDKYGFDPRCRDWYDTGKRMALQEGASLHITPPYVFADGILTAQSATSPLIDPRTGSYVGQVLLDFSVTDIFSVLTSSSTPLSKGGFPLLITVVTDAFGSDTVIGPGFNGSVSSQPVSKVIMPFDQECQDNERCAHRRREFEAVVASMKAGNSSTETLEITTADGGTETVYLSFAPVSVPFLDPTDESDFARGALVKDHLTYSLGLAETGQGILEPFMEIQADMQRQISVAIGILVAVIVVAVGFSVGISYLVTRSISEPMTYLLELFRLLNRNNVNQDPPMIDQNSGSKEIINVANTMESLYRVVRLANLSFYIGDLEAAYHVLVDALRLFKRLDNEKAIGVACNNLGNTMLAMYREMQIENVQSKFGVTRQEIIARGTAYFSEAIQLGEQAYDRFHEVEGWSPNCLDFMQHLSNRYFNRAIFLLTVKDDHQHPGEIESLGMRDLEISRDMDAEIAAQGEESGWGSVNRSEKLFNVHLVRIRGYLLLVEAGYSDDWDIDESLQDLFQMLADESKKPRSHLFDEVSYIGRLQQAETEAMKYLMIQGNVAAAAKIAVRMLMEDEHVFLDAEARAVKVLKSYLDCGNFDEATRMRLKEALEEIVEDLSEYDESRRQSVASSRTHSIASQSLRKSERFLWKRPSSTTGWSVSDNSGQFVTMEDF